MLRTRPNPAESSKSIVEACQSKETVSHLGLGFLEWPCISFLEPSSTTAGGVPELKIGNPSPTFQALDH